MSTRRVRDELRALETPELERRLAEMKENLIGLRFGLATRQTENTASLGQTKRQIARILTILNERKAEG